VKVVGCASNQGTFTVGGQVIECDKLTSTDPSTFKTIPIVDNQLILSFKPPADVSGNDINGLVVQSSDGQPGGSAFQTIPFDVVRLNNAPTIYIGAKPANGTKVEGKVYQETSVEDGAAVVNKALSLYAFFQLSDIDVDPAKNLLDLTITTTDGEINFAALANSEGVVSDDKITKFEGTQNQINDLMNRMTWKSTAPVQSGTVTIVVSDKGQTGKCLRNSAYVECVLTATIVAHVSSGDAGKVTNIAAIAGPIAAVAATAAAAAAAAAAALLMGASKSTAAAAANAGFDNAFEGIAHVSEIHQGAGTSGVSAIFEGAV